MSTISVSNAGVGYNTGDVLSVDPTSLTQAITYIVKVIATQKLTFTGTVAGVTKAHVGLTSLADLDSTANTKLSGIATGANNYVLPSGVPTGVSISGTTLSFTTGGGTVNLTTQDTNTTYSASDFNITDLAGYSDANYKNSTINQSFIQTAITNNSTFLQDIGAPSTSTTDNLTNKTQNLNTSGNISSSMTVGSSKVTIAPANERILIAD